MLPKEVTCIWLFIYPPTIPCLCISTGRLLELVHGADATLLDWSDPATWPNGKVRNNSSCFYIFEHFIFMFLAEIDFQKR